MWLRREGSPRSCAPAAHTSGTRHTHASTRVLSLPLSLFLFLAHECACTMYLCSRAAASRSRERNRESILARLRTCMRRMLAWCTGPLYVHSDVLSPSRECSRVPRYIASCLARAHGMRACVRACVSTCERTVCLHAKRQRHAVPHTGNPSSWDSSLASLRLVSSRSALRHLASLTYDTIRTSHKAGR